MSSPQLTVSTTTASSDCREEEDNEQCSPQLQHSANSCSSNDQLLQVVNSSSHLQLRGGDATGPALKGPGAYADPLDQHEDDITRFLSQKTIETRQIDQFDVAQAQLQSQAARVNAAPPPPPIPPPESYDALLNGQAPGRKSPSLPIEETTNRMLFGKNDKALQRRRVFATTSAFTEYEADLSSSDREKAKRAVMRFLKDKIRTDWSYNWPGADDDSTEYEHNDDGVAGWAEREDWESGVSTDDEEYQERIKKATEEPKLEQKAAHATENITTASPPTSPIPDAPESTIQETAEDSAFRFETPEKVGEVIQRDIEDKKRRRRERRLEAQSWNIGLDCWTRRRDAWTCAREVPPTSRSSNLQPPPPLSPSTPTQVEPKTADTKGKSTSNPTITTPPPLTQIPIAHPLIPPRNVIRSQIGPLVYGKIYEKVVTTSITPSVPINLKDITRSCVEGWKREGDWPPRAAASEPSIAARRKGGMGRIRDLGSGLLGGRRGSQGTSGKEVLPGVAVGGGEGEGRRTSLASVLGLERVRHVFSRRGSSGAGKEGEKPPGSLMDSKDNKDVKGGDGPGH